MIKMYMRKLSGKFDRRAKLPIDKCRKFGHDFITVRHKKALRAVGTLLEIYKYFTKLPTRIPRIFLRFILKTRLRNKGGRQLMMR